MFKARSGAVFRRAKAIGSVLPWALPFVTEYWDGNSGITIATGVSQWDPIKGTHSFTQGTANARPSYSGGVLTFDGSNDYLQTAGFTLNQPETIFLIVKQVTWADGRYILDGGTVNKMILVQGKATGSASPWIRIQATSNGPENTDLTVGTMNLVTAIFNGASSLLQVGNGTAVTSGNVGVNNAGGLTIGAAGNGSANSNIQVMGIGYSTAVATAAQISQFYQAAKARYGL